MINPLAGVGIMKLGMGEIAAALVGGLALITSHSAQAQQNQTQRIAAKSGETIELFNVFAQVNCRSILLATPEVEILDGPPELTISVKEQFVPAPRFDCHNKLKGGTVLAIIGKIDKPIEGKLTFRVKYKTKAINNQQAYTYFYSLFP
jgi:hypothetical protein